MLEDLPFLVPAESDDQGQEEARPAALSGDDPRCAPRDATAKAKVSEVQKTR